jgi:hypothetical protein
MKSARLRTARLTGLLLVAGTFGCATNDLSLSILQMQAVVSPGCVAMATMGGTTPGRSRGLLDVSLMGISGYIGVPVVRNNLMARSQGTGSVELNSVQITGVNVALQLPATATGKLPAADTAYFVAAAGGRIDPGGIAAFFAEILPARIAKELTSSIPSGGLLTIVADVRPVALHGGDQVVGGPILFPIDLCNDCLLSNTTCPFPAGVTVAPGGCFQWQDDPTECCTDTTGKVFCGASAPVAKAM